MAYETTAINQTPKQRPELRERAHSFIAANEHLDVIHTRLCSMRDRLSGSGPTSVSEGGLKQGRPNDPPLTTLYTSIAEETENHISRIRSVIEEIERVI